MALSEENLKAFAATKLRTGNEKDRIGDTDGASKDFMHAAQYFIQAAGVAKKSVNIELYKKMANDLITKLESLKKKPIIPDIPDNTVIAPDEKRREKEKEIHNLLGIAYTQNQQVVKWDDISGLDVVLQQIKDFILPVQRPNLFSDRVKPWNGILIFGPAGTGKTSLAQAVATEVKSAFFFVSSMEVMTRSVDICEEFLRRLFALAREKKPSIVFLDNIDRLAFKRSRSQIDINEQLRAMHVDTKVGFNEAEDEHRVAVELFKQVEEMVLERDRVFLFAASNSPWDIDLPVLQKFEKKIYIPLPDAQTRDKIFRIHLATTSHCIDDRGFLDLADRSEGFTGKDIEVAVRLAGYYALRPLQNARCFKPFSVPVPVPVPVPMPMPMPVPVPASVPVPVPVPAPSSASVPASVPGPTVGSYCIKFVPSMPNELGARTTTLSELKAEGLDVVIPPITIENAMEAVSNTKRTVTEADVRQFEAWARENRGM